MLTTPDRDCAHLRCDFSPIAFDDKTIGSKLTNWCCELSGDQSCGTDDCPADRGRYAYSHITRVSSSSGVREKKPA